MSSDIPTLEAFKSTFSVISELPYCTGTVPLDPSASRLFYRCEENSARILDFTNPTDCLDFTNVTDSQLENLARACQPASFGRDQQDVIDETYRRAGKMDPANFASQFSVHSSGILETVGNYLIAGQVEPSAVKAELYKLNVYGPGSFFKSHVDTPRNDTMFGSLVIIFPTVHEGGALIFTHSEQKWPFDSATAVSSSAAPHVAFVAFYSDVEHEVLPVTSGYRVTLTYNLYTTSDIPQSISIEDEHFRLPQMQDSLAALLADPTFLPKGGYLGFALTYKYPFTPDSTKLSKLAKRLKGADAALKRLCEALSLKTSLKALYRPDREDLAYRIRGDKTQDIYCMVDEFAKFGNFQVEEGMTSFLTQNRKAQVVYSFGDKTFECRTDYDGILNATACVAWIKPLRASNKFKTSYMAYGNDARMDTAYGEVCLVAKIEAVEIRLNLNAA